MVMMLPSRCRSVGVAALLTALFGGAVLAQKPEKARLPEPPPLPDWAQLPEDQEPPVFEEEVVVNEVLLDVLVTDKAGRIVTGLGVDDFIVVEDGRMMRPESVTFYGDPDSLKASGPERSDRYFIFFFHHQKSQSTTQRMAQNRMARDARKWLLNERFPNDQVAVVSFDLDLWLHQDFTRDQEKILAAVDAAARGKRTRVSRGSDDYETDLSARPDRGSPSLFRNLPRYRDFRSQTRTFQEALELVAKGATGLVGRKNMLLFSHGFGQTGSTTDLHADSGIYKRLAEALNTSNIAVYGIDVIGIRSGDPKFAAYGSMSQLSYDTGGRYFDRDTNFLEPLHQVGVENLGYYLITYQSAYERGTSGYRQIQVAVPKGEYFVRGRSGYRYGNDRRFR